MISPEFPKPACSLKARLTLAQLTQTWSRCPVVIYWFTETVAQPLAWKSLHPPDAGQQRSPNDNQSHPRSLALRFKDLRGPCSRVCIWLLNLPVRATWILTAGVPSCSAARHQHPRDPFLDTCKGEPFTVGQLQAHKSSDFKEAQSLAFLCICGGRNLKRGKRKKKRAKMNMGEERKWGNVGSSHSVSSFPLLILSGRKNFSSTLLRSVLGVCKLNRQKTD